AELEAADAALVDDARNVDARARRGRCRHASVPPPRPVERELVAVHGYCGLTPRRANAVHRFDVMPRAVRPETPGPRRWLVRRPVSANPDASIRIHVAAPGVTRRVCAIGWRRSAEPRSETDQG